MCKGPEAAGKRVVREVEALRALEREGGGGDDGESSVREVGLTSL